MSGELFDPGAPEIFVSGLAAVEDMGGGVFRFVFFTQRPDGREAAVKLIAPMEAVPPAALKAVKAVGYCIPKGRFCLAKLH